MSSDISVSRRNKSCTIRYKSKQVLFPIHRSPQTCLLLPQYLCCCYSCDQESAPSFPHLPKPSFPAWPSLPAQPSLPALPAPYPLFPWNPVVNHCISWLIIVLVSQGCFDKLLHTGWLTTTEVCFLTVLRASPNSRCWKANLSEGSGRDSFLVSCRFGGPSHSLACDSITLVSASSIT